jgi:hypothetical protein
MNKMGYSTDGTLSDGDQSKIFFNLTIERRTIVLEKKDLQPPSKRASVISSKTSTFNYDNWYKEAYGAPPPEEAKKKDSDDDWSSDENDELDIINSKLEVNGIKTQRKRVLHFIPSVKMKLLKGNCNFVMLRLFLE